jgi:hypothetical protein
MQKKSVLKTIGLVALSFLVFGTACSTTKSVVQKIKPEKPLLKKRVMVFSAVDHSGLPIGKAAKVTTDLIDSLKDSDQLLIFPPPEGLSLDKLEKEPQYGIAFDNAALAKMAKDRNMNAVLGVYLPPIQKTKEKRGVWPLRREIDIYKVSMVLTLLDATNGCLYLTEFYSEGFPSDSEEDQKVDEKKMFEQAFEAVSPDMLDQQASAVLKTLAQKPWTGRILEAKDDTLTINGGKDVGVFVNQEFRVYSQGESIQCITGRSVDMLGNMLGKIKVTSVGESTSSAVPVDKGPFSAGETIVFSPE